MTFHGHSYSRITGKVSKCVQRALSSFRARWSEQQNIHYLWIAFPSLSFYLRQTPLNSLPVANLSTIPGTTCGPKTYQEWSLNADPWVSPEQYWERAKHTPQPKPKIRTNLKETVPEWMSGLWWTWIQPRVLAAIVLVLPFCSLTSFHALMFGSHLTQTLPVSLAPFQSPSNAPPTLESLLAPHA